jgi:D-glycero-D-manno-heptose 1,7-bisphosphate phosphatase
VIAHGSALFLDRDGVINVDRGYVHRCDQLEFVPGIFELARFWTNELRRQIVVVTNQSGIGRGYFDEDAYAHLMRWMCDRFAMEQAAIARVYYCPYHPVDGIGEYRRDHPWRKPNPGMILTGDPAILSDKMSDIEAGAAQGLGCGYSSDRAMPSGHAPSHEAPADLAEALALLRSRIAQAASDCSSRRPLGLGNSRLNLAVPSAITMPKGACP